MPQLIFQAIADPTRREIIDLLAASPMPVNDVASHFDISRPAISRHIKILQECDLVVIRQSGRKRYCRADTQKLQEIIALANQYRGFWNNKLDALDAALEYDDSKRSEFNTRHDEKKP